MRNIFPKCMPTHRSVLKKHAMERLSKALNVGSFTLVFIFSTNIRIHGFYTDRPMKLQKMAAVPDSLHFRRGPGNEVALPPLTKALVF